MRWAEGSGDLTGALMFRVGFADETLILRGITHLVEHLALFGLGAKRPYAFNGFVDGNRTVFHARGTPEQVESFMNHVCRAIVALPLERLEAESRILRN